MRVSDAERAEVADRLATHYSDGRLDKAEFDERVARAMSAKTRADLNGLFDDLPDVGTGADANATSAGRGGSGGGMGGVYGPTRPYGMSRRPHHGHPVATIAIVAIAAFFLWHAVLHVFFIPWFAIIVLIAAVVFVNRASHRARRDRQ
ncbi:MAG TPA: DUF1707 domain-containing protein [Trebonia sp.]|nr:DUF1707 domain-containing protein [Trebonia sp.]